MVDDGRLPANQIYTVTVAFPSSVMLDSSRFDEGLAIVEAARDFVDSGRAHFASYRSVLETWRTEFESEPSVLEYNQIDPAEYTCGSD